MFPCRRMLPQGWSPIKYCSRLITRQSPNDRMTSSITTSNRAPPDSLESRHLDGAANSVG